MVGRNVCACRAARATSTGSRTCGRTAESQRPDGPSTLGAMSKGQRFANAAGGAIASGSGHLGALGIGLILACVAAYIASTIGTSQLNDVPRLALAHNDETLLRFTDQFAARLRDHRCGASDHRRGRLCKKASRSSHRRGPSHGWKLIALQPSTSNRVNPNEMADRALQWSSDVERLLGDVELCGKSAVHLGRFA